MGLGSCGSQCELVKAQERLRTKSKGPILIFQYCKRM